MKLYGGLLGMVAVAVALVLSVLSAAGSMTGSSPATTATGDGRYLVMIGGCNDCHTHGFRQAAGKVPESDWLTGDTTGWWGPWGTTYPTNLRLLVPALPEDTWVQFAREIKTQPPMPWWALRAMHEPDLRAMHRFIKTLGPKGEPAPSDLPPDRKPPAPYVHFLLQGAASNP